ncbi:WD40 repeat domain-containing protein [Micromonospora sp. NPDC049101]|uniref:WD40 repeat domain-containing protein n=1 Tax=Micromonospora sp. NPDC049101 TaxID=3155032 RepID=UPI00340A4273
MTPDTQWIEGRLDETTDPRAEFARKLQALRQAVGLSVRQLESESEHTPRRRNEDVIRLKRATIAGMTSQARPVRPELVNFEVFVDTCLRVAADKKIALPPDLAGRAHWDEAYRELRDQLDRSKRRSTSGSATTVAAEPEPSTANQADPEHPRHDPAEQRRRVFTRRRIITATPAVLLVAAGGIATPRWLRGSKPVGAGTTDGYDPAGRLLSAPTAVDNPVWATAVGVLLGKPIAVVGRGDGTVQVWDLAAGTARSGPLPGHDKPVYSVGLQGPLAVSASADGTLRAWDLTLDTPRGVRMGDPLPAGVNSVALGSIDGRTVAVSGADDRTVRLWDPGTPRLPGTVVGEPLESEVKSIAVGALNGVPIALSGGADGTIRLWDLQAQRAIRLLGMHADVVGTLVIGLANGKTMAVSGSEDGEVRLWDLTLSKPSGTTLGRIRNAVKTVAIGTISGRTVAISGNDDNTIRIWDLATGAPFGGGLTGPERGAEAISIGTVEGRTVAVSGHWDGTIWTWNL